ncbi:Uncharacterized protein FWK35_00008803 [Aphis craccivora]|uniref:Uncharacterized protein n=1 Tax=Aphis craccivora TaxID=307492 RepID=A0A6G0YY30_APHCR|nr:Uncharacterized protein FWK35_00008803 [Aphis craccivora]
MCKFQKIMQNKNFRLHISKYINEEDSITPDLKLIVRSIHNVRIYCYPKLPTSRKEIHKSLNILDIKTNRGELFNFFFFYQSIKQFFKFSQKQRYLMDDIIFLLKFGHSNILTEYIIVPTTNAYTIFYSDFNSNVYHKHSFTFKFIKILKPIQIKTTSSCIVFRLLGANIIRVRTYYESFGEKDLQSPLRQQFLSVRAHGCVSAVQ